MDRSIEPGGVGSGAVGGRVWAPPVPPSAVVPRTAAELRAWCAARGLAEAELVQLLAEVGGPSGIRLRELRGELSPQLEAAIRRLATLPPPTDPAAAAELRAEANRAEAPGLS